jgi:hypothetical protein
MKGGTYMTQLYAWRRPAFDPRDKYIDHTYVTDYKPYDKYSTIQDVIKAGTHFWYCWGEFKMKTTDQSLVAECPKNGILADLAKVICICKPNDENAHGTIFTYLIDGVCHQLANQVLYPTNPQITVKGVKGWQLTHFLYTKYGLNDKWDDLKKKCMDGVRKMPKSKKAAKKIMKRKELHLFVHERLGKKLPQKKRDFLSEVVEETDKVRRNLYDEMKKGKITPEEFVEGVNKVHDGQLLRIAAKIGREDYIKLFGAPPEEPVHLIDPKLARAFFKTIKD